MELTKLLDSVKAVQVIGEVQRKDVSGIFYDSRKVKDGSVFVAIKGYKTDGHKFILDAISKGALAVVLEDYNAVPDEIFIHRKVAKINVRNSRRAMAELSSFFYKEPSKKIKLIGITGTNGKTTTSFIIKNILENAGYKTGLVGTIANYIGSKEVKSSLTTPEANDLNAMLYDMIEEGCKYAVMEVSSHSLSLDRVYGLEFSAAIFSNITIDHLDFHSTFENYIEAKRKLFLDLSESSLGIYNADDKNSPMIIDGSNGKLFSYGISDDADFRISDIGYDLTGTTFKIFYNNNFYEISTSLIGKFNAYNAASAFAATVLLGISPIQAVEGIKTANQVPGRFEVISKENKKVIVDYSHTPDSLEKTLEAIRSIAKENPIYTVFGCGGDRDKTKRPQMGKIACNLSKKVFITSDNPRTENPNQIIKDIVAGFDADNFEVIENREEAINSAITNSEDNAVVLIAGKGHENYQEINGVRHHFSDKEIAEKYLSK